MSNCIYRRGNITCPATLPVCTVVVTCLEGEVSQMVIGNICPNCRRLAL